MVNVIPISESGKGFDIVASALTACAPMLRSHSGKRLTYSIDGYSGDYPLDGSYSTSIPADHLRQLMSLDEFVIQVRLTTPEGWKELRILVVNDLICAPVTYKSKDGLTNGVFGDYNVCYPEALNPAKPRSVISTIANKSGIIGYGGRPYYGVIVTEAGVDEIVCHGPSSNFPSGVYIGTESNEVGLIDIFSTKFDQGLQQQLPDIVAEEPAVEVDEHIHGFFIRDESGRIARVQLTQAATLFDGRLLDFGDFLKTLQMACLCEFDPGGDLATALYDNGSYIVDVKRVGGRWYIGDTGQSLWATYCAENTWLRSLFSNLAATKDELFLCDASGGKLGSVSREYDSQACYALSYAYLIGLLRGGSLCSAVASLQSAVSPNSGLTYDGKYILANQSAWGIIEARDYDGSVFRVHKSGYGLAKKGKTRGESYDSVFTLDKLIEIVGDNGAFILGYDPDTNKPVNNRSDHFIVARIIKGRIRVEFDPYRVEGSTTYAKPGTDVTPAADSFHEACVHIFKEVINE